MTDLTNTYAQIIFSSPSLQTLDMMSVTCFSASLYAEAIAADLELLQLISKKYRHEAALVMNRIARAHLALAHFDDALTWLQQSLKMRLAYVFNTNGEIAETMHLIGKVYIMKGKFETALGYLRESLATKMIISEEDHPSYDQLLFDLGKTYEQLHDDEQASLFFHRCMIVCSDGLLPSHATTLQYIGSYFEEVGSIKDAIHALDLAIAASTPYHTDLSHLVDDSTLLSPLSEKVVYLKACLRLKRWVEASLHKYITLRSRAMRNIFGRFSKGEKIQAARYLLDFVCNTSISRVGDVVFDEGFPCHRGSLYQGKLGTLFSYILRQSEGIRQSEHTQCRTMSTASSCNSMSEFSVDSYAQ